MKQNFYGLFLNDIKDIMNVKKTHAVVAQMAITAF